MLKTLGLTDWPKSIRLDTRQLWGVQRGCVPVIVVPRDTCKRLALTAGPAKLYADMVGTLKEADSDLGIQATTVVCSDTWVAKYRFDPTILLRAWLLRRHLKSGIDLRRIFELAARMAFTVDKVNEIMGEFDKVAHRLPGRSLINDVPQRLLALDMLYERQLISCHDSVRHWSPDSSPQGGYNWFAGIMHGEGDITSF